MMSPSPRILMTTDAVGGVWVYATTLARMLCREGCRVTLVTLGPSPRPDQLLDVREIRDLELRVTDLALEWMDPEGRDTARATRDLARIEYCVKPDVVHLNGYREALADWKVPVLVVAHSCVRSWSRACRREEPRGPEWAAYAENVHSGLAAADIWAAPTRAFRDTIQALYDPPTQGRVIWNGIDFAPHPMPKEPFILAAGRLWDEAKNVASLSAVAARLPWPIRVAGPSALSMAHSDPNRSIGALDMIGELPRPMLMHEMQRAAIFVAPAVYEPFGLTVLEAAAAGCALVLSDIPTFRELWHGAALFVDGRDLNALQSALMQLIQNGPVRRTLQRQAAQRARRYSASAMSDTHRELYQGMVPEIATSPSPRRIPPEARP